MTTKKTSTKIIKKDVKKEVEEVIPLLYTSEISIMREPHFKDHVIGQAIWTKSTNAVTVAQLDTAYSTDLEQFVEGDIVTAEGRTYNPKITPKEWVLNLHKVGLNKLWHRDWTATEARPTYEN